MRIKNKKKKVEQGKTTSSVNADVRTPPTINEKIDAVPFTLGRRNCKAESIRSKAVPKLFVTPEVTTALYQAASQSDEDRVFVADVQKSEKKEDYSFICIRETEEDVVELIDTDKWVCLIFLTDKPLHPDLVDPWKQLQPKNCEYFFVGHANRRGVLSFNVFCYKHNKIIVGVSNWEFYDDMYLSNEEEESLRSEIQEKMSVAVPIVKKSKPTKSSSYLDGLWGGYGYDGIGFPNYETVDEQINRLVDVEEEKDETVDTECIYGDLTVVGTITDVSSPTEGATASAGMLRVNVENEGEYTLVIPCDTIAEFEDQKYSVGETIQFYRDPQAFKEKFTELDFVDIQHVDVNTEVKADESRSALLFGEIVLIERDRLKAKRLWRLYIIVNVGTEESHISIGIPAHSLSDAQKFVEGALISYHPDDFLGEITYAGRSWNVIMLRDVHVRTAQQGCASQNMTTAIIKSRVTESYSADNDSRYVYLVLGKGPVHYNMCFAMPCDVVGTQNDIFRIGDTIEFPAEQWIDRVRKDRTTYHEFDWNVVKTARRVEGASDEELDEASGELKMKVTEITVHDPIAQHAPYILAIAGNSDDFGIHRICVESWCATDGLVDIPFSVGDRLAYNIKDVIGECEYEGQKWLKVEKALVDDEDDEPEIIEAVVQDAKIVPDTDGHLQFHALAMSDNDEEFVLTAWVDEGDTYPTKGDVVSFPVGERKLKNDAIWLVQLKIDDIKIIEENKSE